MVIGDLCRKKLRFFHNLLDMETSNSESDICNSSSPRSEDRMELEREYSDDSGEIYGRKSVADIEDDDFALWHGAYADEPLADEEWLQEFDERQQKNQAEFQTLSLRLNGTEPVNMWYVLLYMVVFFT